MYYYLGKEENHQRREIQLQRRMLERISLSRKKIMMARILRSLKINNYKIMSDKIYNRISPNMKKWISKKISKIKEIYKNKIPATVQ